MQSAEKNIPPSNIVCGRLSSTLRTLPRLRAESTNKEGGGRKCHNSSEALTDSCLFGVVVETGSLDGGFLRAVPLDSPDFELVCFQLCSLSFLLGSIGLAKFSLEFCRVGPTV